MQVRLTTFDGLTAAELSAWVRFQEDQAALESPYFRPEFTKAVSRIRADVEVAVLQQGRAPVGFFPFQRIGTHGAKPVGGRLSDYQAVIGRGDLAYDPFELLRSCGLVFWDFDHLLTSQTALQPFRYLTDVSPYLDLTHGWDAYCDALRPAAKAELQQTLRKSRKIARELGPLRFVPNSQDETAFELLILWKAAQYQRTDATNVLAFPWTTKLLHEIWREQATEFAGQLSVLYAGPRPIAAHFGLRSRHVLHWWFPAYDPACAAYSPGRVLLAELARTAPDLGVRKIDLGRGLVPYKARVMSGTTTVAEGSIDRRPLARRLRLTWRHAREWVRQLPLYGPARLPGRLIHRLREWIEFQ